jgi:hypothetical protein
MFLSIMTELTNLLPPERLAAQREAYFIRLGTVALWMLVVIVIASGALLVPAYLYVDRAIRTSETAVQELDANLVLAHGKETNARLAALTESAAYLTRLATTTTATSALRTVLAVPRSNVTLSGFSFTPPVRGVAGRMTIVGVAGTREALRGYYDALLHLPAVTNGDLPISAYAKDVNIPFTITLTGSFLP